MTDPHKDEHIEELLSKLQGIFGKLSHTEEEESKQKIEIPINAPKEPTKKEAPPPVPAPEPETVKKAPAPNPINLYAEPASPAPAPAPTPVPAPEVKAPSPAPTNGQMPTAGNYESQVPTGDPEKIIVPTAVYFPTGKENEAKALAQKLEMMAPKFTKVAFRLRIALFAPYDSKSDWKDPIINGAVAAQVQTVFVAMDRPLDDAKKKAIAAELETKQMYFQDVPMSSIEKKAFYTDILLGLVFFFDSHRPPPADGAAA